MKPSFLNLFMKKLIRERVVPTISANDTPKSTNTFAFDSHRDFLGVVLVKDQVCSRITHPELMHSVLSIV
jgi:hypothetical protein